MPIKGLTDRGMMFPEIGQIRKGDKKDDTKNAPGRDLPYFRVEFDEKEAEAASKFSQVYGDKPTDIAIVLPFNEVEKCWDAWLEAYRKGRMVARADGERYLYKVNDAGEVEVLNGEPLMLYSPSDVLGTWKDGKGKVNEIKCKPVGRLKVVIPELQRLAFLTLHTTSYHDVKNIQAQLEAIAAINGGRLAGIPLVLRRRPKKISTPKPDGTSARYTKYMISIEADPDFVKRMLVELKTAALPGNGLALLPEPEHKQLPAIEKPESDYQEADFEDEIEEGDFEEEEPEPEPQPAQHIQAPKKVERPMAPEKLREMLQKKAASYGECTVNQKQVGLLASMIEVCFAGVDNPDKIRHSVVRYLAGTDSLKEVQAPMVKAMLDFLKPVQDSGGAYAPDEMAVKEIKSVWTAALKEAGQESLPLE